MKKFRVTCVYRNLFPFKLPWYRWRIVFRSIPFYLQNIIFTQPLHQGVVTAEKSTVNLVSPFTKHGCILVAGKIGCLYEMHVLGGRDMSGHYPGVVMRPSTLSHKHLEDTSWMLLEEI